MAKLSIEKDVKRIVVVKPDAEQVAEEACRWLVEKIQESIRARDRCVIAVSGGSTPKRLYQMLADLPSGKVAWDKVHLIWGDERNVPLDHPESNFGMVRKAMLDRLGKLGPNVYPVPVDVDQPEKTASYYEATLKALFGASDEQMARTDVVLLGLGDDSHTASLFPHTSGLTERKHWAVANWVEKLSAFRITLTAPFLNEAQYVVFLVCGEGKRKALESTWNGPYQPEQYPAQLIRPTSGELLWILDQAAAIEET